ncbi:ABC transporter substrate-binding protein [Acaryochloris sp. IP29b_bin.137]|uniref:ABC transporter substrate-binding protein n=1 Tax=Acaryochloris sp. IP29b_bin.137 TaxID=2969217 RepID=UPI00262F0C1A|nr:ABC transporter substrate-binding protein [Acaryochloris sp. IP29b_bin.137]
MRTPAEGLINMKLRSQLWRILNPFHRLSKRLRFILLSLLVCLSVIGSYWVWAQQPVRLSMMLQAQEIPNWQLIVDDFEAQNPNVKIDLIEGPNATNLREDLYTTSFLLGDSPYDLIYMDIVWAPKFAAAGWLLDISERISEEELAEFMQGDVDGGRYEEGLYRMPFRSDGGMLYYRQDLLAEAGFDPPETTAELLQISKALQSQGKAEWGYLWQGKQYEGAAAMFVEMLEGFGGYWVNPETKEVGLDTKAAIAAVQFLQTTVADKISPPGTTATDEEVARNLFQTGNAVFMRNWPYAWKLGNDPGSSIQGKFGIKPMVHAAGFKSGACQGGWGVGISKTTRHPDEAWKAVQYFSSTEAQRKFILASGFVPSRKALFTDPALVAEYQYLPDLQKVIESSVLRPPIAQYAQASDILQRYLSAALTGQQTPAQAMQAAAQETRQLLKT